MSASRLLLLPAGDVALRCDAARLTALRTDIVLCCNHKKLKVGVKTTAII